MTVKVFCDICDKEITSATESRINVTRKTGPKLLASWDVCQDCDPKLQRALASIKDWVNHER